MTMSCGQLPTQVILVPQLSSELLKEGAGQVQYLSLSDEQLQRLTGSTAALLKTPVSDSKLQDNQVIDFLALNEEVQFIKTESCAHSPSGAGGGDFGGGGGGGHGDDVADDVAEVMDSFDASPLLHETSKDVALSTLQHSAHHAEHRANLTLADDTSGAPNTEYDAEDLLLAQLQTPHGNVGPVPTGHVPTDATPEDGAEMDEDERAASEYLNDGQLYLEKSKRQVQVQLLHGHHLQQQSIPQQIVIASSAGQVDPKCEEQMDCTSTNLTDTPPVGSRDHPGGVTVSCSTETATEVPEVTSTTLEPPAASPVPAAGGVSSAAPTHTSASQRAAQQGTADNAVSIASLTNISQPGQIQPSTVNIVDAVVSASSPTVVQSVSCLESKIRVLSLNGVSGTPGHHVLNVASAGEPVLLGNILLVPETPTVKLQIVQEDGSAVKELSVRGVGAESPITLNPAQLSLGSLSSLSGLGSLNGLSLGNISLLGQAGLALQAGQGGLTAVGNAVANAGAGCPGADKKNQKPFHCKLCTATFNRLGNYTRHQKIHTVRSEEDERFHCDECGKSFIQRCDLTRHLHVHAGTEPHRCDICGKGYIRHSDLVTHQRFHNKEKPFLCQHCPKGFSQRGDLNRHLRSIHLQIRPLTCGHCQKKFAKEATLMRHMRTSHRDIVLRQANSNGETSVSEALITGTGDICTATTLGERQDYEATGKA